MRPGPRSGGAAIRARVEAALGRVDADSVLAAGEDRLRACGLSRAKARSVSELADAIAAGRLDLDGLARLDDEAIRTELTHMRGIGEWTADIYLMFALGRPDIMPVRDMAVAAGAQRLMGLRDRPRPKELKELARAWRPWRTTAALLLWRYYRIG